MLSRDVKSKRVHARGEAHRRKQAATHARLANLGALGHREGMLAKWCGLLAPNRPRDAEHEVRVQSLREETLSLLDINPLFVTGAW